MRNIVARLCMSEDGIVDRPEYWLPESGLAGVFDRLVTGAETVLLGRSTFEQYAASVARYHEPSYRWIGLASSSSRPRPVIAPAGHRSTARGSAPRVARR